MSRDEYPLMPPPSNVRISFLAHIDAFTDSEELVAEGIDSSLFGCVSDGGGTLIRTLARLEGCGVESCFRRAGRGVFSSGRWVDGCLGLRISMASPLRGRNRQEQLSLTEGD
jgi:hypothetical protein